MRSLIHPRILHSRTNFLLAGAHFLHSASAILLLLMVGQAVSQGDSTKAKLLKLILPAELGGGQFWFWVVAILLVKFLATFLKNYLYPLNVFRIQGVLREYGLKNQLDLGVKDVSGSELKRYAKAFVKGVLYLCSDILMLGLIFALLMNMNTRVAVCWLFFILLGLALRYFAERIAPNSKKETNKASVVMMNRWKKWRLHSEDVSDDSSVEREFLAFKESEKLAKVELHTMSLRNAWAAGFFPVYFFIFLFFIARNFGVNTVNHGNILQMLLLIVYSQGAIMRLFKAPIYWKEMRNLP